MKLIVGLGNIGKEYQHIRHNVGFDCVELLCQRFCASAFQEKEKFFALIAEAQYENENADVEHQNEKIVLAQPTTFMNLSGQAVSALVQFYKVDIADLLVMYDDLDLPLGHIRVRPNGGPGTHNGMKSVVQMLGSEDFPRIRIGVESRGRLSSSQMDTADFVLSQWGNAEKPLVRVALDRAADALEMILQKGLQEAMNVYNE